MGVRGDRGDAPLPRSLLAGALALAGCQLLAPFSLDDLRDAAPAGGDASADAEAESDAASDAEVEPDADLPLLFEGPGPLTFLADRYGLTADPLCDVDGDGAPDNAVLQYPAGVRDLALAAFGAGVRPRDDPEVRLLVHLPRVEDRSGASDDGAVVVLFTGVDSDDPPDPSDDFALETFRVEGRSLDGCGEPRFHFVDATLEAGRLEAREGEAFVFMHSLVPLGLAQAGGSVEPGGAAISLWLCGAARIHDLGRTAYPDPSSPGMSMLNAFVGGSAAFGVPGVPGITPDIDLDGDGLERFEVGPDGHILRCVDGDLSVIEGAACWEDPRMADAFSISLRFGGVPAAFGGRADGWERTALGACDAPPETSLFDP